MPHMRFVFLGPEVRLQLPSDTTSRRLPLLFGLEFPSSRPPEDSHLLVTSRFGFPYRFPSYVHHARRFAPCPAHVGRPCGPRVRTSAPLRSLTRSRDHRENLPPDESVCVRKTQSVGTEKQAPLHRGRPVTPQVWIALPSGVLWCPIYQERWVFSKLLATTRCR